MNKEKKLIYATSARVNDTTITAHSIEKTMAELNISHLDMFKGLPVMEDPSGMLCAPDGYVVLVGSKLYAQLREAKRDE